MKITYHLVKFQACTFQLLKDLEYFVLWPLPRQNQIITLFMEFFFFSADPLMTLIFSEVSVRYRYMRDKRAIQLKCLNSDFVYLFLV